MRPPLSFSGWHEPCSDPISVDEFKRRLLSFREKMGTKLEARQYRSLTRMLIISYLCVNQDDPDWGPVPGMFMDTLKEYATRMRMMGMHP